MKKRNLCSRESVFLDHTDGEPTEAPDGNTILIDENAGVVYFGLDGKWYKSGVEPYHVPADIEVEGTNLIINSGAVVEGSNLTLNAATIEGADLKL